MSPDHEGAQYARTDITSDDKSTEGADSAPASSLQSESERILKGIVASQDEKHYHKLTTLRNIRTMMGITGVKVGKIEKAANVQQGYMSRLEKIDSTVEPSLEFIAAAAQLLGVPVDYLLYGKVEPLSESEEMTLDFIKTLTEQSHSYQVNWDKDNPDIDSYRRYEDRNGNLTHPLVSYSTESKTSSDRSLVYTSLFYPEFRLELDGCSYNTYLKGQNVRVYLMSCRPADNDNKDGRFLELYLYDLSTDTLNPFFCTLQTNDRIRDAADMLYAEAADAATHIRMSPSVKAIIGAYLEEAKGDKRNT